MSLVVEEAINIAVGCNDEGINTCVIGGVKNASVIKFIAVVADTSIEAAKSTWTRMKERVPGLDEECVLHSFGGRTGDMVVAPLSTLVKVIANLNGENARAFRECGMKTYLEVLLPSREFAEDVMERQEERQELQELFDGSDDVNCVLVAPAPGPRKQRRFTTGAFYVRIRVPEEHMVAVANRNALSLRVIKFGIAYDVPARHGSYMKNPDNGYMAFSFPCDTRGQAVVVEEYIKDAYAALTVWNSKEYLDAQQLAMSLDMEYDGASYEAYVRVARALFVSMVERLKLNYPGTYDGRYGSMYSVVAKLHDPASSDEPSVSFPSKSIPRELAIELGFAVTDSSAEERAPVKQPVPAEEPRQKSKGPVISRHLETGEEQHHSSVEIGARTFHLEPKNVRDCVDKARQCGGYVWRSLAATTQWVIPPGLIVTLKPQALIKYVRGVVDGEDQVVFENRRMAATLMGIDYDKLKNRVGTVQAVGGKLWDFLPEPEWNTFVNHVGQQRARIQTAPDNGANGRSGGKIIARDIRTGEETTYDSVTQALARLGLRGGIKERLGMPMQAVGKAFRRFDAPERWEPPSYFKFRTEDKKTKKRVPFENKCTPKGYVVALEANGDIAALYESKTAASELADVDRGSLTDLPLTVKGVQWRDAREDDYNTFVRCAASEDAEEQASDASSSAM